MPDREALTRGSQPDPEAIANVLTKPHVRTLEMLRTLERRIGYLELVVWLDTAVLFLVGLVALHVL